MSEWQAAEGSRTLHVIDPARPAWRNLDGSRRRSGPRAVCGRYPQRNAGGIWCSWPVAELPISGNKSLPFLLAACPDCRAALPPTEEPT